MQRGSNNNHNGTGGVHQACASCKHQRKKCGEDCILAPYFPADRSHEFQAVHKVFGVSNVIKMVRNANQESRKSVVDSLIWEAFCRKNDPILGPLGEYRKIEEELKLYKSQYQLNQNQLVQQGSMVYKQPPVAWTNGINNNGNGIGRGIGNNNGIYSYENGHMIVDSMPNGYPLRHGQSIEKVKQEKDASSLVPLQLQHLVNGFNHQQYFSGQFGSINGKTMDNNTLWQDGP